MINEVALVLLSDSSLADSFIYVSTGLFISIFSGWVIGKLKLEKWVEEWVYKIKAGTHDFDDGRLHLTTETMRALQQYGK